MGFFSNHPVKVRPFEKELRIEPIFVEAIASIFTGLLVLFWGWVWLSNELYQLDVFTRIRNAVFSDQVIEERMERFLFIDFDPDSYFIFRELPGVDDPELKMISETLRVVSASAESNPERRFVLGFDIALFASVEGAVTSGGSGMAEVLTELGRIPENLYVVLGSRIVNMGEEKYGFPRSDYLMQEIFSYVLSQPRMEEKDDETLVSVKRVKERLLGKQIFLGGINYLTGVVRSAGEEREDVLAALGYYPVFLGDPRKAGGFLVSLPFFMYLLGEMDPEEISQNLSLGEEGYTTLPSSMVQEQRGIRYYDFRTNRDVTMLSLYRRLKDLSPGIRNVLFRYRSEGSDTTHSGDLNLGRSVLEDNETVYIFSGYSTTTGTVMGKEFEDIIVPTGADKNPMTGEAQPVSGVMAHITALDNLLHNERILRTGLLVQILLALAAAVFVFFIAWRKSLLKSIGALLLGVGAVFLLGIVLFSGFHVFIPLKIPFVSLVLIWTVTVGFRFLYSLDLADFYSRLSGRFFNAEKLSGEAVTEWYKPRLVTKGFIMLLQPGRLPSTTHIDSDSAEGYAEVLGDMTKTIFDIIEKNGGGHDNIGSGIIGIWGVFGEVEENVKRILQAAVTSFHALPEIRAIMERRFPSLEYRTTFDVYLDYCSFYFGAVRTGGSQNIVIGGNEIIRAQKKMQQASSDVINSLTVSASFAEKAIEEGLGNLKEKLEAKLTEDVKVFVEEGNEGDADIE